MQESRLNAPWKTYHNERGKSKITKGEQVAESSKQRIEKYNKVV